MVHLPNEKKLAVELAEGILYTDMYQLTMAQLYFRMNLHEKPVLFEHYFRSYPDYGTHKAGFASMPAWNGCWIGWLRFDFGDEEIDYWGSSKSRSGTRLFRDDFLTWLHKNGDFSSISLSATPRAG